MEKSKLNSELPTTNFLIGAEFEGLDHWDFLSLTNEETEQTGLFTEEEEVQIQSIEDEVLCDLYRMQNDIQGNDKKRKRYPCNVPFWQTIWGKQLLDRTTSNPLSQQGKLFRRRFRMPLPLFKYLVKLCREYNIFDDINVSKIPLELKVLGCLRILGRDACSDDVTEVTQTFIAESTMNYVFKKFVNGMVNKIYPIFVKTPTGDYLKDVLKTYASAGLPGCVGSMDCTHVKWSMCPKKRRFHAKGKEGFPSLAFQVVVDHHRRVTSVSQSFFGALPDKTIAQNDLFSLGVMHGALQDITYTLYDAFGNAKVVTL